MEPRQIRNSEKFRWRSNSGVAARVNGRSRSEKLAYVAGKGEQQMLHAPAKPDRSSLPRPSKFATRGGVLAHCLGNFSPRNIGMTRITENTVDPQ